MYNFAVMLKPKKPSLESIKEKHFSDKLKGLKHCPHNGIVKRIDSKLFSLDANRVYHYKPEVLAGDEYKRCLKLFEKRLPNEYARPTLEAIAVLQHMQQARQNVIFNMEMRYHDKLKEIAETTIRELFDIPEYINLISEIEMNPELDIDEQDNSPDEFLSLSEEDKKEMNNQIKKREILNGLVHGCSMHIWKSAHYIIKDKIDNLNPLLMSLYDEYTTSISWLIWQINPDEFQNSIRNGQMITQGFNELKFHEEGKPECDIHCHAVNFPVLLHELTKGAMDYLICRGIPKHFNEEELKYYYAKADSYENELYHYLLSPTLWVKLIESSDVETQELPKVIANLSLLNYEELTEVMKAMIDGIELGKLKLKKFKII